MTSFLTPDGPLRRLQGPSSSQSSSSSTTYDYAGLEDHVKRQDAVEGLRGQKFAALYAGDIPTSVAAGGKVRNLLRSLRRDTPGASERDPHVIKLPLAMLRSTSSSSDQRSGGGEVEFFDKNQGQSPTKKP